MRSTTWIAALAAVGAMALGHEAAAQPDLTISPDSRVRCGEGGVICSCADGQPLWQGVIALRNEGTSALSLPAEASPQPMLRVYTPYNPTFAVAQAEPRSLNVLDQQGFQITLGRNVNDKRCEAFDAPPTLGTRVAASGGQAASLYRAQIMQIQRELNGRGVTREPLEEDGMYGADTRDAVRRYLSRVGIVAPSRISADLRGPVSRRTSERTLQRETIEFLTRNIAPRGTSASAAPSATAAGGSGACKNAAAVSGERRITIIAEVNPRHRAQESNYANNRFQFDITVNCSR